MNGIRKQDGVFIRLLSDHRVEIIGYDLVNVDAAKGHYETMIEKVRTDKGVNKATNVVMDEEEGIDVVLLRAESWWPNLTDVVMPRLLSSSMMFQAGGFREEGVPDTQLMVIRDSLKSALEAVSYRKGSYDFAVRLGCIALPSKQMGEVHVGKKFKKDLFIKSINGAVGLAPKKWYVTSYCMTVHTDFEGFWTTNLVRNSTIVLFRLMTSLSPPKPLAIGAPSRRTSKTLALLCVEHGSSETPTQECRLSHQLVVLEDRLLSS